MKNFLTEDELAKWADERASQQGPFSVPEEKLLMMLDFLRQIHYHIISSAIQDACKKRIGMWHPEKDEYAASVARNAGKRTN